MTPTSDPTGLAAAVTALATAILTAVDPSGVLTARWQTVIVGVVAVVSILWARRRTWSPQAHADAVKTAAGPSTGKATPIGRPAPGPGSLPSPGS